MPGILLVGHGDLPAALLSSARMIGGALPGVRALGLQPGETPESFRDRVAEALDADDVEVVLSDLAGGTPDNVVGVLARTRPGLRVIAGASLPLLLELAIGTPELDNDSLDRVIERAGPLLRSRTQSRETEPTSRGAD